MTPEESAARAAARLVRNLKNEDWTMGCLSVRLANDFEEITRDGLKLVCSWCGARISLSEQHRMVDRQMAQFDACGEVEPAKSWHDADCPVRRCGEAEHAGDWKKAIRIWDEFGWQRPLQ